MGRESPSSPTSAPLALRLAAVALGVAVVAGGALLGAWYLPFVAGVAAGVAARGARRCVGRARGLRSLVVLVVLGPVAWAAVLTALAWRGARIAATGATVAALVGLPARAEITLALTLLIALLQTVVGAWLGRALADSLPSRRSSDERRSRVHCVAEASSGAVGLDGELRADALDIVRDVPEWRLTAQRWSAVETTLQTMSSALSDGDHAAFRAAVHELELSGPTRAKKFGAEPEVPPTPSVDAELAGIVFTLDEGHEEPAES